MVNDLAPTEEARRADPGRLLRAYQTAASTLNLLRAVATGGERPDAGARLEQATSSARPRPAPGTSSWPGRSAGRWTSCGPAGSADESLHGVELYCSHEALILEYERALTRPGVGGVGAYDLSGHFVWVGDRTRARGGAHIDFVSRIANPIGHEGRPVGRARRRSPSWSSGWTRTRRRAG